MIQQQDSLFIDGGILNPKNYGQNGKAIARVTSTLRAYDKTVYLESTDNTSQEAEAFALVAGIIEANRTNKTIIFTDSQFWFNVVNQDWNMRQERLKLVAAIIKALIEEYKLELKWVPREENLAT